MTGPALPPAVAPGADDALQSCAGGESFALAVLGDSMEPEFSEGDIIVIEPEGLAVSGSYVLAFHDQAWIFRQLLRVDGRWRLCPLNPRYPSVDLADLSPVRGVVIQKARPGRRKALKRYI